MKCLPMFLAASFTLTTAGVALAADTRSPMSSDEARAYQGRDASVPSPASGCELTSSPASTDQARAAAGKQIAAATSRTAVAERSDRAATSTDDARALAAARTSTGLAASNARHEEVCASCACKMGEQHARAAVEPCGCHKRT